MSREILYWKNRDDAEKSLRTFTNIGTQANDGGAHPDIQAAGKRVVDGVNEVKDKMVSIYKDIDMIVYNKKESK